jgi:hypothetical protein
MSITCSRMPALVNEWAKSGRRPCDLPEIVHESRLEGAVRHHRRQQHQAVNHIRHGQRHLERDGAADRVADHQRAIDAAHRQHRRHVGRVMGEVVAAVGAGAPPVPAEIRPDNP